MKRQQTSMAQRRYRWRALAALLAMVMPAMAAGRGIVLCGNQDGDFSLELSHEAGHANDHDHHEEHAHDNHGHDHHHHHHAKSQDHAAAKQANDHVHDHSVGLLDHEHGCIDLQVDMDLVFRSEVKQIKAPSVQHTEHAVQLVLAPIEVIGVPGPPLDRHIPYYERTVVMLS